METVKLDERGRLLLEKPLRTKYGDEFVVVDALDEIVLIPVPKDPLKALRAEGRKLPDLPVAELKKLARNLARKEVLDEVEEREQLRKKTSTKR